MSWQSLLSTSLTELRIHFCPQSTRSNGLRSFLSKNWSTLQSSAGTTPIFVREALNAPTRIVAVYPRGIERIHSLEDADEKTVNSILDQSCAFSKTLPPFNPEEFALPSANKKA
jgi:NADH dehydrogenase (ubiquinone) 1 alpha subcomplex subunit 2